MYQNGCFKIGKKSAVLKEISHPHEDHLKMAPKRFSDSPTGKQQREQRGGLRSGQDETRAKDFLCHLDFRRLEN